jgi:uncharacterized protein (TIGR02569 family)
MAERPVCTDRQEPSSSVRLLEAADWEWRRRGPTGQAVRAFGARAERLRRLAGGSGHAWTDGRLVLKPVGCVPEHAWVCGVYANWTATEVRVPEPVMPRGPPEAGWSCDGWGAHVFMPGRDAEVLRELDRVKEASDAFHQCVRDLRRPSFMDKRDDPWAFGDRLAWEDAQPEGDQETLAVIERLRGHLAPVTGWAQVIHGDILPNVLLADGLSPAVIDWPPYFRPSGLANAIAATDAVTFRAASLSLLDQWSSGEDWNQLLIRALLYRLGPTGLFASRNRLMGSLVAHVRRVGPVVDAILSRQSGR